MHGLLLFFRRCRGFLRILPLLEEAFKAQFFELVDQVLLALLLVGGHAKVENALFGDRVDEIAVIVDFEILVLEGAFVF